MTDVNTLVRRIDQVFRPSEGPPAPGPAQATGA